MKNLVHQARRRLGGAQRSEPDPLRTLEVQARLSRLAGELRSLEDESTQRFARRHHGLATTRAYEQTLAEACQLAGIPLSLPTGPADRLAAEASLLQAGWTW